MSFGRGRPLVLTFDAFGTLFHPCKPIGQQYAETARKHGLTGFTDQDLEASFRKAFKYARKEHSNYGKAVGLDANRWWANVIHSTFSGVLPTSNTVPEELVASLLHRFSSKDGYRLYDDVVPFFEHLRRWRDIPSVSRRSPSEIQIGIISNSDDRVPSILTSLGISVCDRRYGSRVIETTGHSDIGWVVLSYNVGIEKPDKRIFDAAREMSASFAESEKLYIHVGDSIEEDYRGGLEAGWKGVLLDREGRYKDDVPEADRMTDLTSLMHNLMHSRYD
ncbi:MAG: hypothetical protein Q9224_001699 [Gallowayella concinna]